LARNYSPVTFEVMLASSSSWCRDNEVGSGSECRGDGSTAEGPATASASGSCICRGGLFIRGQKRDWFGGVGDKKEAQRERESEKEEEKKVKRERRWRVG